MANHKSAKKRARQAIKLRTHNRYYKKTARTAIRNLQEMTNKADAEAFLPKVVSKIDKLVKRNVWHKNKGANIKSKLMKHIASL